MKENELEAPGLFPGPLTCLTSASKLLILPLLQHDVHKSWLLLALLSSSQPGGLPNQLRHGTIEAITFTGRFKSVNGTLINGGRLDGEDTSWRRSIELKNDHIV